MTAETLTPRRHTLVSFHAHPDDEALLTAGTLARAAAAGHRVVLVVATAGEAGLASRRPGDDQGLGATRLVELRAAAAALGCCDVVVLGYADSGLDGSCPGDTFVRVRPEVAAHRLAEILVREDADVLTVYDPAGGYGHPDHRQVHRVGVLAAAYAGTPVVLEATVDRRPLQRAVWLLRRLSWLAPGLVLPDFSAAYADPSLITHRVDVTDHLEAKRASLAAHASQATADTGTRTLALLLRLPRPLFRRVLRYEWYVEHGRAPGVPLLDDVFATLTPAAGRRTSAPQPVRSQRTHRQPARRPVT